jgi:acetylglutamate kinase
VLDGNGNLLSSMRMDETQQLIGDAVVKGGMIPKLNCCLDALRSGVRKAHIVDGRKKHAILLEVFTKGGIGTEIVG